jgi:CMP-N-acetylneuraminic acid synthetase
MSQVIALIPARAGSKGIPGKNFRVLGDRPLWHYAADCAHRFLRDQQQPGAVVLSTDAEWVAVPPHIERRTEEGPFQLHRGTIQPIYLRRPANLAQDDTPMLAVVQHALEAIPGEPDDVIVLLQPTQPFRTPERVREAIALLQSRKRGLHSVVSVAALPPTHAPDVALWIRGRELCRAVGQEYDGQCYDLASLPTRRQDVEQAYIRDGTVYAFYRRTVTTHGNIYGPCSWPLIIPPEETAALDTEADWEAVQTRWQERHATTARS